MRWRTLSLPILASLALAGCASDEASTKAQPPEGLEAGAGGIDGQVVSEELFPVPSAEVSIGHSNTTTDANGRFRLAGLAPGVQTLRVNATGYEPHVQQVEVPLEGFLEVTVPIKGVPGQAPYAIRLQRDGFNACSYTAFYTGSNTNGVVPCPFGQTTGSWRVEVGPDWRAGVHELAWRTSEQMTFLSTKVANGCRPAIPGGRPADDCPAFIWGKPPLRVFARPEDKEYAKKFSLNGTQTWPEGNYTSFLFGSYQGHLRDEVNATAYPVCAEVNRRNNIPEHWGCPLGVGYSTGIRYTFYHSTFYLQAPVKLEEFTALPDS